MKLRMKTLPAERNSSAYKPLTKSPKLRTESKRPAQFQWNDYTTQFQKAKEGCICFVSQEMEAVSRSWKERMNQSLAYCYNAAIPLSAQWSYLLGYTIENKSQQKVDHVLQLCVMTLRSGHTIKKACYFRNETTKTTSSETGNKHKKQHLVICNCRPPPAQRLPPQKILLETHREEDHSTDKGPRPVLIQHASLITFDDQFITFADEGGAYTIYVEDLRKNQKKNKVVLLCYDSEIPAGESGYEAGAVKYMVNLSLSENRNFCLHADSKQLSVDVREFPELQKPEQTFFLLHRPSSIHYSFECKSNPGTYLGVSGNHLELIPVKEPSEPTVQQRIMFKLS